MAKSFKSSFAGAVGITLAASCFASDADAMTLRAVGGWARTPNVSLARPVVPYARPIIPYRAPIIPYRSPGATVTTGSMAIVARYRQAQWQQQGQKLHQIALQQQAQKQSALWQQQAQKLHQTTLQQTTQQVANTVGTQLQNVPYRCTSLDNQQCLQASAAANQAAVAAQQQQQMQQQQMQQTPQRQMQKQAEDDAAANAAQAASLRSQLYMAKTQSDVDYIRMRASFVNDPGLNADISLKQSQLQNQSSIFNSSPGAIGK